MSEEAADMLSMVGAAEAIVATATNIKLAWKAGILEVQGDLVMSSRKRKSIFEEKMSEI
jgi:hypothetical protein